MHAGPYISGQIKFLRGIARYWREQADRLEAQAASYRQAAEKAETQADWWEQDTDYERVS